VPEAKADIARPPTCGRPFMVAAAASIKLMVSELLPSLLICDLPESSTTIEAMEMDDGFRPGAPQSMFRSQLVSAVTDNEDASGAHRPSPAQLGFCAFA
jgi:hypothetical protein